MHPALRRALGGVVLCLAAGALPLTAGGRPSLPQLRTLRAQEPQRASQALGQAQAFARGLGFQAGENLAVRKAFTNQEGRTVVRFQQTYQGTPVYGATTIGHVAPEGQVRILRGSLQAGAVPVGEPRLGAAEAQAIALRQVGLKGAPCTPKVAKVVFPTALTGGLKVAFDESLRKFVIDKNYSLLNGRPAAPYVWAWQVDVFTRNSVDGVVDQRLLIDADTGAVLKRLSNLHAAADGPTPIMPGAASTGWGLGQYVGAVTLNTTTAEDGTSGLRDQRHGSKPNPYFLEWEGVDITGITTFYEIHAWDAWGYLETYAGNPTNLWGDGNPFMDHPHEADRNGQSAAVDAHYGLGLTWEMFQTVFGHDGLDGQGTTPFAIVHMRNPANGTKWDNAMWSSSLFGMFFGDGNYLPDLLAGGDQPYPGIPTAMMSLTELDVAGHELAHGLTFSTAELIYAGESGGLNEASSDIFGSLVEAYHTRREGDDPTVIPNTGTDWLMGAKCSPSGPMRFMKKPSKDFLSADHWYEGLDFMEVHYSSGPMNRCFYFLSQGASPSASDDAYSPFLPQGMNGIGNDKAGRIYFKALTEYMSPTSDYADAGACMAQAAIELYGEQSPEYRATVDALTAINVQVPGAPLLTRVTFPVIHNDGLLGYDPGDWLWRLQTVPLGTRVALQAQVLNNSDQGVAFKVGAHRAAIATGVEADPTAAGLVHPDGTWTSPLNRGFLLITAASKARPEQIAEGMVNVVNLDADADNEQDAIDLGATALSWYLPSALSATHSPYGNWQVDDFDVQFCQDAIRNAWSRK